MPFKKETVPLLYASTSASLLNFLNHTDVGRHYTLFNEIVNTAYKAHQDLMTFGVDDLILEDPYDTMKMVEKKEPPIFISFYIGSYNMLIASLLKMGANLHVLSDTESVRTSDFQILETLYSERYRNRCTFCQINTEQDGSIFKILRAIKQGFPILAFLDGNKGIGGLTKENSNLIEVKFMQGRVKVRKGLAITAYLTKRPIVVALSYMRDSQTHLRLHKPIEVDTDDREQFVEASMKTIFMYFESHVSKYFSQWCSWPYVHNWSDLTLFKQKIKTEVSQSLHSRLEFNEKRFCPIRYRQGNYLFDRYSYTLIPIDPIYNSLFSSKTSNFTRERIIEKFRLEQPNRLRDLLNKQILIKSEKTKSANG